MDVSLEGQVAIVTGGASGIGRGISEAFAKCGASVVLTYYSSDQGASDTVAGIERLGGTALAMQADFTREDEATRVVNMARDRFGKVDILVANSGGLLQRSSVVDCSLDLWNTALAVNLTSTFLICRAVLPLMLEAGSGSIITMSSLAAHDGGGAGSTHYSVAKAGVHTFTKALAKEVGPFGIRVNSIAPGLIATRFHDQFNTADGRAAVVERTPLRREGVPADVAGAATFLASSLSGFVTGELIEVNGGQGLY